ncbi:hypothetical protein IEQ34_004705 [Dendrobium chrysotoxum]|uniref:Uncharacterized protein n=1 Tax=Dendrobium chrysotoxum TaxID=161865 RepID=A0AAV7HGP6_DENCH|nr:hypothetical protein IEQ34_004705 [Dendrobium chrysotoxum]
MCIKLHPCCAALLHLLDTDNGLRLHLHHKASVPCHKCGLKGISWCYRSICKKYNLHENWHKIYYGEGSSNSGTAMAFGKGMLIVKAAGNSLHRNWMGNVKKCCKLVALARFINRYKSTLFAFAGKALAAGICFTLFEVMVYSAFVLFPFTVSIMESPKFS